MSGYRRNTKMHPPELLDEVEQMWNAGNSAAMIARFVDGLTRNAVIGIVTRLRRKNSDLRSHPPKTSAKALPPPPALAEKTKDAPPTPAIASPHVPVPMTSRTELQCPYPLWADDAVSGYPDFPMCGGTKDLSDWYCPTHTKSCLTGKRKPPSEGATFIPGTFQKPAKKWGKHMAGMKAERDSWEP